MITTSGRSAAPAAARLRPADLAALASVGLRTTRDCGGRNMTSGNTASFRGTTPIQPPTASHGHK
jgi:hypothetical protein